MLVNSLNRVSLARKVVRQKLVGILLLCLRRIKMLVSRLLVLIDFRVNLLLGTIVNARLVVFKSMTHDYVEARILSHNL